MSNAMTPELENFVEREIASGRFASREAVVVHALEMLRREREDAVWGIQAGLDDVEAGRTQPLADAFRDLRAEFNIASDA